MSSAGEKIIMNRKRTKPDKNDPTNPTHYAIVGDYETIDILREVLTPEEFRGFCKGNSLKYLMRANKKDNHDIDLEKAEWYLAELHSNTDDVPVDFCTGKPKFI